MANKNVNMRKFPALLEELEGILEEANEMIHSRRLDKVSKKLSTFSAQELIEVLEDIYSTDADGDSDELLKAIGMVYATLFI